MKRFLVFGISILAVALTPACDSSSGGGGGGGGGGLDTGLDEGAALSDLTPEEQVSACEAANDFYGSMSMSDDEKKHFACMLGGAEMAGEMFDMMDEEDAGEAGDPVAMCQAVYDECMASEGDDMGMGMGTGMDEPDTCVAKDLSACTDVTVGQVEACADANMDTMMAEMAVINAMTCEDAMAEPMDMEESSDTGEHEAPAACVTLEEDCPSFADDDGGGGGFDTGLDEATALSDLTDAEQVSACQAAEAYWSSMPMDDYQHMMCLMMGGMMAGMTGGGETECQAAYDECMADEMETEDTSPEESDCTADDLSACTTVTVGDLEAYVVASMAQAMEEMAAGSAMTCADVMSGRDGGMVETPPSAAVTVIEEGCPALGNDDGDYDYDGTPPPGDSNDMDDDGDGGTDDGEGSDDGAEPEPVPAG
jgi:hypothetical protein